MWSLHTTVKHFIQHVTPTVAVQMIYFATKTYVYISKNVRVQGYDPLSDNKTAESKNKESSLKWGRTVVHSTVPTDSEISLEFYLQKCEERRAKWIAAIHQAHWNSGPETRICCELLDR